MSHSSHYSGANTRALPRAASIVRYSYLLAPLLGLILITLLAPSAHAKRPKCKFQESFQALTQAHADCRSEWADALEKQCKNTKGGGKALAEILRLSNDEFNSSTSAASFKTGFMFIGGGGGYDMCNRSD
jgi:hypothetical protein